MGLERLGLLSLLLKRGKGRSVVAKFLPNGLH